MEQCPPVYGVDNFQLFFGDQLLICDAFGFETPGGCRSPKPQVENYYYK